MIKKLLFITLAAAIASASYAASEGDEKSLTTSVATKEWVHQAAPVSTEFSESPATYCLALYVAPERKGGCFLVKDLSSDDANTMVRAYTFALRESNTRPFYGSYGSKIIGSMEFHLVGSDRVCIDALSHKLLPGKVSDPNLHGFFAQSILRPWLEGFTEALSHIAKKPTYEVSEKPLGLLTGLELANVFTTPRKGKEGKRDDSAPRGLESDIKALKIEQKALHGMKFVQAVDFDSDHFLVWNLSPEGLEAFRCAYQKAKATSAKAAAFHDLYDGYIVGSYAYNLKIPFGAISKDTPKLAFFTRFDFKPAKSIRDDAPQGLTQTFAQNTCKIWLANIMHSIESSLGGNVVFAGDTNLISYKAMLYSLGFQDASAAYPEGNFSPVFQPTVGIRGFAEMTIAFFKGDLRGFATLANAG